MSSVSAGKIVSVSLRNFKCHYFLDFNLNSTVNFINGKNGSGKSAIMDAIILCLGDSSDTGSQKKAASFIKIGETFAELKVCLSNEGFDSYQPKKYGKRISIERVIYLSGRSRYKVLNDKNQTVSIAKSEIINISEHFNIQVYNPVCFLNQEISKVFFKINDDGSKYELFLQASQLDSMKRLQKKIEIERNLSLAIIEDKEQMMVKLQSELFDLEQLVKQFTSIDKLRRLLCSLHHEMIWAYVKNDEKELIELMQSFDTQSRRKLLIEKQLNTSQCNLDALNVQEANLKENLNSLNNKINESKTRLASIDQNYVKDSVKQRMLINESKKLSLICEKKKRERDELKLKLEKETESIQNEYNLIKMQNDKEIQNVEFEIIEKTNKKNSFFQRLQLINSTIDKYEKQIDDRNFEMKEIQKKILNLYSDLSNLKSSSKNQIFKFGKEMAALVDAIELNRSKFEIKPLGPIGLEVQIKDEKYMLAIEKCLGSLLYAFVCNSYNDEKVIQQLISNIYGKVKNKPKIIVTNFQTKLYDVSRFRPEFTEYPTVYEMLQIENSVIANVLIDSRRIESIILLPDYETARKIIEFGTSDNLIEGFTPNGDQFIGKPSYRVYANSSFVNKIFSKTVLNLITSKENEISNLKQHLPTIKLNIESMNTELFSNKKLKFLLENDLVLINDEIVTLKSQQDYLKTKSDEMKSISAYEDELNNLEVEIKEIREKIKSNQKCIHMKNENKTNKAQLEYSIQNLEMSIAGIKNQIADYESQKLYFQNDINDHNKIITEISTSIQKTNNQIKEQQIKLDKSLKSIKGYTRVETNRSVEAILNQIEIVEKQIKINENVNNQEDVTNNYILKRNKFNEIMIKIKKQKDFLIKLEQALRIRDEKLIQITKNKSLRCATEFAKYMFSQNFVGNLKFNHEEKTLKIDVKPNISKSIYKSKDLISLSGGERSYSKVAFLLSLWSIVESPVFFLDEFDVFMDEANRQFTLNLLIESAKKNLNEQYIFLTPVNIGFIKRDDVIKVFKMPDAKRDIIDDTTDSNMKKRIKC